MENLIHFAGNARRLCDGNTVTRQGIRFRLYKAHPHWYEKDLEKGKFLYATAEDLVTCSGCLRARHAYHLACAERLQLRLSGSSETPGA